MGLQQSCLEDWGITAYKWKYTDDQSHKPEKHQWLKADQGKRRRLGRSVQRHRKNIGKLLSQKPRMNLKDNLVRCCKELIYPDYLLLVSVLIHIQPFATRTGALQAPLPMGFSRQEGWSGLPFSSSRGSSPPRDRTFKVSCTGRRLLKHGATWEALSPN